MSASPPVADATLREVLRHVRTMRPDRDVRERREDLANFLRKAEAEVLVDGCAQRDRLRRDLGWDDETLHSFIDASLVSHSSPHASMNVFAPNFAHPWLHAALRAERRDETTVHVRTMVTHNNLGDLKYKTYAWWRRSTAGDVVEERLFPRSHRVRHKTLLSQRLPDVSRDDLAPTDREALELAKSGATYAYSALIYRNQIERAGGLHEDGGLVEVPLDVLNAWSASRFGVARWGLELRSALTRPATAFRTVGPGGELEDVSPEAVAERVPDVLIAHNFLNFLQVYLLGVAMMSGGKKMASYVGTMNDAVASVARADDLAVTPPLLLPFTAVPTREVMPIEDETAAMLRGKGIEGPLAVGVTDHGRAIRTRLDGLLDRAAREIHPEGPS